MSTQLSRVFSNQRAAWAVVQSVDFHMNSTHLGFKVLWGVNGTHPTQQVVCTVRYGRQSAASIIQSISSANGTLVRYAADTVTKSLEKVLH